MDRSRLRLVDVSSQSPGGRARRLQSEARAAAQEHMQMLATALNIVATLASEIAGGGDAYPVGARELCRAVADESEARFQTLEVICHKASQRVSG